MSSRAPWCEPLSEQFAPLAQYLRSHDVMYLSADMAFSIGLFAGWLALVVWLVWPDPHCACCAKRVAERIRDSNPNT
jgi:hypothetical protein